MGRPATEKGLWNRKNLLQRIDALESRVNELESKQFVYSKILQDMKNSLIVLARQFEKKLM